MFGINDRSLKIMYGVGAAVCIFFGLCGIAGGIVIFVAMESAIGVIPLIFGPLMAALLWLVITLRLAEIRDIKFIRNKLYGLDNDEFIRFTRDPYSIYDDERYGLTALRDRGGYEDGHDDRAPYVDGRKERDTDSPEVDKMERELESFDDKLRDGVCTPEAYVSARDRLLMHYFRSREVVDEILADIAQMDADLNSGILDEREYTEERKALLSDYYGHARR